MLRDTSAPLFTLTIGEYIELTREIVLSVIAEKSGGHQAIEPDIEEHFTLAECARFLRCSVVSLHKYKKQGLPYYKIGRKILFKKSEVLEFMNSTNRRYRFKSKRNPVKE